MSDRNGGETVRRLSKETYAAAAFAVLLTACTESTAPDVGLVSGIAESTVETVVSQDRSGIDAEVLPEDSNVAAVLKRTARLLLDSSGTETAQQTLEFERETQTLIAACMRGAGFEWVEWTFELEDYEAFISSSVDPVNWVPESTSDPSYGVVVGYRESLMLDSWASAITPNDEIRAALGSDDRALYDAALYGESGCGSTSSSTVQAALTLSQAERELLARFRQQVILSDATTGLFADWAACMKTMGYGDLSEPLDLYRYFDPWLASASNIAGVQVTSSGDPAVVVTNESELVNLQIQERSLASADLSCRQSISYSDRLVAEATLHAKAAARALGWL